MNRPAFFSSLGLAVTLLAAGCASSPMSRIDEHRAKYESWPLDVQEAVLNGEARKGMTREQVEVALGKPTEIVSRSGDDEVWVYRKGGGAGSGLLNNTGLSVGTGIGGVSVGTGIGGGGSRRTPEEEEVVFVNGVVVRSDVTRSK